jgi:uncharacterized membrane protein YphA (DoxX/SURF4 family)
MAYAALAARVLIGLVFVVSAAGKLRAYGEFVTSVRDFRLLPPAWDRPVAAVVVAVEVAVPVLLLVSATARLGAALAIGLLAVLTAAVWSAVQRGTGAVCRCFGVRPDPLGPRHVARNLTLLVAAGLALGGGAVAPAGVVVAVGAAVVAALVLLRLDDLADLFRGTPAPR